MPIDFNKKYNILVSSVLGLGSTLFFIPFLKVLRMKFKNSNLKLLTWENNNVFKGVDFLDEVIEVKHYVKPLNVEDIDLLFTLRTKDESNIQVLSQPSINAQKKYVIGQKDRWGKDSVYSKYIMNLPINNAAKNYLFFLYKNFDIKEELAIDALLFNEKYLSEFKSEEDLNVCLCLGNWSNKFGLVDITFYIDLIEYLVKNYSRVKILLIGKGGIEQIRAYQIIKNCHQRKQILNLVNLMTIQQLVKIFLKSRLVIGQDTGVIHLASCLNKDIVLLTNSVNFNYPVSNKSNYIKLVRVNKSYTLEDVFANLIL